MDGIVDRAILSYAQMPDSAKIAMLSEAISQLQSEMAVANSRIEEIDGDFPQQILMGGGDDSAATPAEYTSYFKLYDASTGGACKIGVTDAGATSPTNCGVVKINGVATDVLVYVSPSGIEAEGTYYVWLHSWIDAVTGEEAKIIVGAAGSETRPDNLNGGIAYGSTLIGRFTVVESEGVYSISVINQDYLKGGEADEWLWGTCEEAGT